MGKILMKVSYLTNSSNVGDGENSMQDIILDEYTPLTSHMIEEGMNHCEEQPFFENEKIH